MMFFTVDEEKCIKCGICSKICVRDIITISPKGFPEINGRKSDNCIACGHCVSFCPTDACSISSLNKSLFTPLDHGKMPDQAEAETFLRTRRSIRWYKREDLDRHLIEELLDIASTAPTAKNRQPVEWSVVNGRKKMIEICNHMAELYEIQSIASHDRQIRAAAKAMHSEFMKGKDVFLRGAPTLAVAHVSADYDWPEDGVIATTYLELVAHARGLGTCWAGYFIRLAQSSTSLRKAVKIPDDRVVVGALMLGKPVHRLIRCAPPRKKSIINWIE